MAEKRTMPRGDFARLWAALSVSLVGSKITTLALPLLAVLADAMSFLISAALLQSIHRPEPPPVPESAGLPLRRAIADGMRRLLGHPLLRAIIVVSVPIAFFTSGFLAIYVLYATRELGLGPATIGLIFAAGGVGAVSGAMLARRAADRFGVGPAMIGGWFLAAAGALLVPLATGPTVVVVVILAMSKAFEGVTDAVANIHQWSLRQVVTPDHLAGRVTAGHRFTVYGASAVGALAGGALGGALGLRPALLVCAVGALLSPLLAVFSPLRRLREQPTSDRVSSEAPSDCRMAADVRLRALDPERDRPLLERLWEAALAPVWPLLPGGLDIVRDGIVAERRRGGETLGVVALDPAGSVPLLLVDPAAQRQGVGTRLLEAGLERLGALGAATAGLGSGGDDYIWPGVPDDLPAAAGFFAARGWRFDHTVLDLTADLRGYEAPARVGERPGRAGVSLRVMAERERAEVLAFEAATFPDWVVWFERLEASVLVARDGAGAVVGTLLYSGPPGATIYEPLLGPRAGTIGCVGVAAAARGAGVGSAMVARASELLRDAGTRACHIGWTGRERFYGRLGYVPWRRYRMARRPLPG